VNGKNITKIAQQFLAPYGENFGGADAANSLAPLDEWRYSPACRPLDKIIHFDSCGGCIWTPRKKKEGKYKNIEADSYQLYFEVTDFIFILGL
jgi:hypothetical protein